MTFKLKLEDPSWVELLTNLENADMMSEVHLRGGNRRSGYQVAVPAILLVAVSPLARNILVNIHAPQYQPPVIIVPSISCEALQKMVEIIHTGTGSVTVSMLGEIQDIFQMFGIEGGLVCSDPKSSCADKAAEKEMGIDNYQLDNKTEDTDLNENLTLVKSSDLLKEEYVETVDLKIVVKVEDGDFPGHQIQNSDPSVEEVLKKKALNDDTQILKSNNLRSFCGICGKDFIDLFHHIKTVHEKIDKKEKHYCQVCKKFISCHNYTRHVKESHLKIRTPCPMCGKFLTRSHLSAHIKSVHKKFRKM